MDCQHLYIRLLERKGTDAHRSYARDILMTGSCDGCKDLSKQRAEFIKELGKPDIVPKLQSYAPLTIEDESRIRDAYSYSRLAHRQSLVSALTWPSYLEYLRRDDIYPRCAIFCWGLVMGLLLRK